MRNITNGEALALLDVIEDILYMIQSLNDPTRVSHRDYDDARRKIETLYTTLG